MIKEFDGALNAASMNVAIVVGRFNDFICKSLLDGAVDCLKRNGADENAISVYWVPGAFEIPLAAQQAANDPKIDAVICLGAVIRGSTPHFDYVCSAATSGISRITLETQKPVIFGILTTDTIEQAIERAGTKAGNKGWEASMAAIEMVNLLQAMEQSRA